MNISHIVCLPDLFSHTLARQHGMLDLIREPIRQGCQLDIAYPPTLRNKPTGLLPGFELTQFLALASERHTPWHLPQEAADYLLAYLPKSALVLSVEMPAWLTEACTARGIAFIDIRISPLRFASDLYVALRTSLPDLFQRLAAQALTREEIRLEASALAANVRMHQALLEEEGSFHFHDLDSSLIYISQSPVDASLQLPDGHILGCDDFADQLKQLCQGRRLFYKTAAPTADFSRVERAALTRISGQPPILCLQGNYQLLSSHADLELTGISAAPLQEAEWFDKTAHLLHLPAVPLTQQPDFSSQHFQQVRFKDFLSPAFWHRLLTPHLSAPTVATIPAMAHHHARETLDQWGDYSAVITWGRTLPQESFLRAGGLGLIQRIESLEASVAGQQSSGHRSLDSRKLVVLGNGPSLKGFDFHSLAGADTLGMNAAYRHWERIGWYPDHYVCLDDQLIETHAAAIYDLIVSGKVKTAFLIAKILSYYPDLRHRKNVFFLEGFHPAMKKKAHLYGIKVITSTPFSGPHLSEITTGAFALRYGAYLGYQDIAILGVDLKYVEIIPEAQHAGGVKLVITETPKHNPNYFFDDYQQAGDKYNIPNPGRNLHVDALKYVAMDRETQAWQMQIVNSNTESVLFDEAIFPFLPIEAFLAD